MGAGRGNRRRLAAGLDITHIVHGGVVTLLLQADIRPGFQDILGSLRSQGRVVGIFRILEAGLGIIK